MKGLTTTNVWQEFAFGRAKLYQYLPKAEKIVIPNLNFTDGHVNTIAKDYYEDAIFSRNEKGDISLWNVYNLFTKASRSHYFDASLDRNINAFDFTKGIQAALMGNGDYYWFLS